jgi:hypothetical protein
MHNMPNSLGCPPNWWFFSDGSMKVPGVPCRNPSDIAFEKREDLFDIGDLWRKKSDIMKKPVSAYILEY